MLMESPRRREVPGPRAPEPKVKARAPGQERLPSAFCWAASFSGSVAKLLEGGGSRGGPHTAKASGSEQRANKNQ